MADVFLSYAADDRDRAQQIVTDLTKRGLTVWSDRTLAPGSRWPDEIARQIGAAKSVLVLVSNQARKSKTGWLTAEAALALASEDKRVVPILLSKDADVPFILRDRQWVDLSDQGRYREQIDRLVDSLKSDAPTMAEANVVLRAKLLARQHDALVAEADLLSRANDWRDFQFLSLFATVLLAATILAVGFFLISDRYRDGGHLLSLLTSVLGAVCGLAAQPLLSLMRRLMSARRAEQGRK